MRYKERFLSVVVLGAVMFCALVRMAVGQTRFTICDVQGCNCTVPAGGWKNVNCHLLDDQELTLSPGHIPEKVTEIYISGGRTITFSTRTFHNLEALAFLKLDNVRNVIFHNRTFVNIQYSSLLVQISGCDDLIFMNRAFENMQGVLSTEIIDVRKVTLEQSPFSNLSNCTLQNIQELVLASEAFEVKNIGSIGKHGPVTVILLVNVVISEIPEMLFLTPLAQLTIRNSQIGVIRSNAFHTIQVSAIDIFNSTIEIISSKTITEKTLIIDFKMTKCQIGRLQSEAVTTGMTNLTVNHSTITDIEPKAIISTAAKVEIIGNQIHTFHSSGFIVNNWNRITIDQNIIKNLHRDFIEAAWTRDVERFSFTSNEIYNAHDGSLNFLSRLIDDDKLIFDDNFFNESCGCELDEWVESITNTTSHIDLVLDTSFCRVDDNISRCFSLPAGIINMQNFTEKACNNNTVCEPYNGETRTINTTGKIFSDNDQNDKQKWLVVVIVIFAIFLLVLIVTFVVLLIRGSRWLKRKGYFRNNYYNNNESNDEEENTIVTIEMENEKLEIPEELTRDFLLELSRRLDDPATNQEASEMIERLYEMFIIDDSFENNNREEEAHLYEELGNLNRQIPPPPYEEQPSSPTRPSPPSIVQSTGPRGILKLMEEKYNIIDSSRTNLDMSSSSTKPILTGEYCEPIDRDVHLYSELKQKDEAKKNSVKSNSSNSMALRPLPDKPEAGPSTKL